MDLYVLLLKLMSSEQYFSYIQDQIIFLRILINPSSHNVYAVNTVLFGLNLKFWNWNFVYIVACCIKEVDAE